MKPQPSSKKLSVKAPAEAVAKIAGLKVDYPKALIRKPKAWLNRVARLNPALGTKTIR
ncbi:MAG: hypothetical protein K2Y20_07325 [Sphingomonas sp.]|nr:hypothetical protein [Sphingomonas sp.]